MLLITLLIQSVRVTIYSNMIGTVQWVGCSARGLKLQTTDRRKSTSRHLKGLWHLIRGSTSSPNHNCLIQHPLAFTQCISQHTACERHTPPQRKTQDWARFCGPRHVHVQCHRQCQPQHNSTTAGTLGRHPASCRASPLPHTSIEGTTQFHRRPPTSSTRPLHYKKPALNGCWLYCCCGCGAPPKPPGCCCCWFQPPPF